MTTTSKAIAKLASTYPRPTNAQALAALDSVMEWTSADAAVAAGMQRQYADSFMLPHGILPRMRLLACGWTYPGDSFRPPGDSWWGQLYKYPLWNPLATYAAELDRIGARGVVWDPELAAGEPADLTRSTASVVDELSPVMEAPCPRWIIPPGKGQLPVANPDCALREVDKNKDKLKPITPSSGDGFPWLLLIALLYLSRRKRR